MKLLRETYNWILSRFQPPKNHKSIFPPIIKKSHSYGSYKNIIWVRFHNCGKTTHYVVNKYKLDQPVVYLLVRFIEGYPEGFTKTINNVEYVVRVDGKE
jgi:hypothetical protein